MVRRGDPGRRVGITLLAIAVMLTLFAGRLVQLQGLDSGYYKNAALAEKFKKIVLPALRGTVYSSNHQVLAMTTETYTITADPPLMKAAELPTVAQELSGPLGLPAAKILSLLQHPTSTEYVRLATGVSVASDQKIEALSVYNAGINDDASYAMAYPDGEATANVVGFANVNPQTGVIAGQAGVEEEYNKLLTGTTGSEEYLKGLDGQQIPGSLEQTPAQNGDSIKLTINSVLQYDAMNACQLEVDKSQAKSCTAVIIQPKTGDILAMAQWPTWDQNTLAPGTEPTDLPDQDVFTPGSTAKVITAAAAFEHGGKTPMSAYHIPYQIYRGGQWIRDAEYSANENYTIAGIIANSSNVGMSEVDASVPPQTQYDYLRNFGLDEPTGLGLPGETQGLLAPPSKWAADERYTLAYGQGIAVNAIQMASVYATIANNGVRVTPRLVEGTYNAAGQYTAAPPSTSRRVIEPKTAKELISILQQVPGIDETANQPWGIIPNYAVASKTGTANESPNEPGESCPASNPICIYGASYIGMAPGNGPQVVVAVNVQDPNKSNQDYFGDMVAGPVFYNVMKDAASWEFSLSPGWSHRMFGSMRPDFGYPQGVIRPARPVPRPLSGLAELLGVGRAESVADGPGRLTGVTHDSRAVQPGDLYAALPGTRTHGAMHAEQAVGAGAVAILTDPDGRDLAARAGVPVFVVSNPRDRLGDVSCWIYGDPSTRMTMIGVTGTSGKTTSSYLCEAGLRAAGHSTALIGGVEIRLGDDRVPSALTTPEAPDLQALLAVAVERGVTAAAMEVSSHSLALGRVAGTRYDVAVFTNLSQDHLDFHAGFEDYFRAKAKLFTPAYSAVGVVNVADRYGRRLVAEASIPIVTFCADPASGGYPQADWQAADVRCGADGSTFRILGPGGVEADASVTLPGSFNVANALGAIVALVEGGVDLADAVAGVASCPGVPGRLQRVPGGTPDVFVDYSHKPGAVEAVLTALRPVTSGELIVVLGCGGDRDRGKRPLMGAAAARLADIAIFTSDNPRTEDPLAILAEMLQGVLGVSQGERARVIIEPDRAAAIDLAVSLTGKGDVVLVAGKGHETGQYVGGTVLPFSDAEVAAAALAKHATGDGTGLS